MEKHTPKRDRVILNLMIISVTLAVIVIIGNNIHTSLTSSLSERQNFERRKKYYEEKIVPANLDLYPARHYIKIGQ